MNNFPEGKAVVYCEQQFNSTYGKTAHGLIRRTHRYEILAIIDSSNKGSDSGTLLSGKANGIPIIGSLNEAPTETTHFVIGLAPDGGRMDETTRKAILCAIDKGWDIDSGLHDFLQDDSEIVEKARSNHVTLRDVRKPPHRKMLHFFSGAIEDVTSTTIAILGTDSAVGKRTTAWLLVDGLRQIGMTCEFIGTGQTAWFQGASYGVIMDALVNDFVAGEIEHAIWTAWNEKNPDVIIVEGQGSLMNPAFPGGFEILAAARPDFIILQHAPARKEYDGFPGYPVHDINKQIQAIELISDKPVIAITVNHENIAKDEVDEVCEQLARKTGRAVSDLLQEGPVPLAKYLVNHFH